MGASRRGASPPDFSRKRTTGKKSPADRQHCQSTATKLREVMPGSKAIPAGIDIKNKNVDKSIGIVLVTLALIFSWVLIILQSLAES